MNKYLGNIGKTTFNKEATEAYFQDKYKIGAMMKAELNTPPTEIRLRKQRAYWIATACIIAVLALFAVGHQEYRIYKLKMEHINTASVLLYGQNMALEKLAAYETIEKKQ